MNVSDFNLSFKNDHTIHEKVIICEVSKDEYNASYNPSLLVDPINPNSNLLYWVVNNNNRDFKPYVTTIGLYNDYDELIMVAKTSSPVPLSSEHNITFILKIDS